MSVTIDNQTRSYAKILWDYHNLDENLPEKADFILAMGSHDDRAAYHAAGLVLAKKAPLLVTSGGYGKVTNETGSKPEGEHFKAIAVGQGVDPTAIVVEPAASNTGDNITLTRTLLESRGIAPRTGIIVTKPYMKRRAIATATKQWPEVRWWASAPAISFQDYPTDDVPEQRMIELMVGDLQRIKLFAEQGFQTPQAIPQNVWDAYDALVRLGFDKYVIKQ